MRFLLVGLVNSAIGYGSILYFQYVLSAGHLASNVMGYLIGGLVSYLLNRSFTFHSERTHGEAMPLFVVTVAACYLVNLGVLEVSLRQLQLPAAIAQGLAVTSYTISFFLLSRKLVFREYPPNR